MPTLPKRPTAWSQVFHDLGERMDQCDQELFSAEQIKDRTQQIALLMERSAIWIKVADAYRETGREVTGAMLSAQRDRATALRLQSEAASE